MKHTGKIRTVVSLVLMISMVMMWCAPIAMAASMSDIRVGLTSFYKDKSTIRIKTTKIGMGYSVGDRYENEITIGSQSGFTFQAATGNFFILSNTYTSYSMAKTVADGIKKLGVDAYPTSIYRNTWKVYVGGKSSTNTMNQIKSILEKNSKYSFQGPYSDNGHRILMIGDNISILYDGKVKKAYPQFKAMVSNSNQVNVIDLGARQYRGRIEIGRYGNGGVTAVNIINIESYLYGVVPCEMVSSWPTESLKAQAVCSRTFALSKTGYGTDSDITKGYSLVDTTSSQVYKGYGFEKTNTNRLVDQTKGQVVTYNGKVISAYFYSTSGGRTEDIINVWGVSAPYLKSIVDEYENEPEKGPWVIAMPKTEIASRMAEAGLSVGNVTKVTPQIRTASDRVYSLLVVGNAGSRTLQKEKVRTVLDLYSTKFKVVSYGQKSDTVSVLSADGMQTVSLSDSYAINETKRVTALNDTSQRIYVVKSADNLTPFIKDAPTSKDVYYFVGMGFGHGVGMSQSGAKGLASQGYSYKKILQYYFKGCNVQVI